VKQCLVSGFPVEEVMSFGEMPIANGFLRKEDFPKERFYELSVGFCPQSQMVQLTQLVPPAEMFHENYAFFSSTSVKMQEHFGRFARKVREDFLSEDPDPFVVEIGSNDGIMLQHFAQSGIRHLGVEPSSNVAEVARTRGVQTISKFFNPEVAKEVLLEHGPCSAFLAANVMCHIPTINAVFEGIELLLKPKGVLAFEDPYLGDIVQKTSYDQIYDEHAFYFSATNVQFLAARYGLEVFDVQRQPVHGGSMRYYIGRKGAYERRPGVIEQMEFEKNVLRLHEMSTFLGFRKNVERSKAALIEALVKLKKDQARVVGYAATSKSTTVTNYCGIGPDLVEFISDTTPIKQGKFSPGVHIPVLPYSEFQRRPPNVALLFAWNHAQEIFEKEAEFMRSGGQFLTYVPKVGFAEQAR
jgi:methylation protein EvaC